MDVTLCFHSCLGILVFTWRFRQHLYWNVLSFFLSIFVTWCFQEELYRIGLHSGHCQFYRLHACLQHVSFRVKDEALFILMWILLDCPCFKIIFGKQGGVRVLTCQWSFPSSSSIRFFITRNVVPTVIAKQDKQLFRTFLWDRGTFF